MMKKLVAFRGAIALCSWLSMQLILGNPLRAQSSRSIARSQPAQITPAICSSQISTEINAIIDRPELQRYRWGIVVQKLGSTERLYYRDGDRLFIPASNVKLITTAVALRHLGAATRLRTSVYQLPSDGTFDDLLVVGRGDPTLTSIGLQSIAQQLKQRGKTHIRLINFDDGYFRGEVTHPDWEWGDLSTDYAPPINSLMLDQNVTSLTISPQEVGKPLRYVWKNLSLSNYWLIDNQTITGAANEGSNVNAIAVFGKPGLRLTGKLAQNAAPIKIDIPVIDPRASFVDGFRQSLNRAGITVSHTGSTLHQRTIGLTEIAAIDSPPIGELVRETNQNSNNVYAEILLKSIGKTHPQHDTITGDANNLGIELIKKRLTELGINPQAYSLSDGSGLSRHNLVAPSAFTQLLSVMTNMPEATIYRDSLPIAGVSGSLKNRMKGTIAQGIVRAKTGSMGGIISLSGYINPPQYSPLVFSIILNQHDRSTSSMAKIIDEIVVLIARLKQC